MTTRTFDRTDVAAVLHGTADRLELLPQLRVGWVDLISVARQAATELVGARDQYWLCQDALSAFAAYLQRTGRPDRWVQSWAGFINRDDRDGGDNGAAQLRDAANDIATTEAGAR